MGIHGPHAEEQEVAEVVGEQALHPQDGVHAGAAAAADQEHGSGSVRIQGRRIVHRLGRRARQHLVDLLHLQRGGAVVAADQQAQRNHRTGDHDGDPATLVEFLGEGDDQD